jgi:hypothetical protein
MAPEAFHGWLGRWVKTLEPVTEADPVALLGLGLGALGHCVREDIRLQGGQTVNQLMVLVGDERAGEGIAWGHIGLLFSLTNWKKGIITKIPSRQYWAALAGEWDQCRASLLARSRPEQILDLLTQPEAIYNGLSSRALLLRLRGGTPRPLADVEYVDLDAVGCLEDSLSFAKRMIASRLRLSPEVEDLWEALYSALRTPRHGGAMINVMTELAERHVLRLAGLYAVVDQSRDIRKEHLLAALAVWDYSEETLHGLFAHQTGDRKQNDVLRSLRERHPIGLTTLEVNRAVLQGNFRGGAEPLLRKLEQEGWIYSMEEPASGRGKRPAHRWFLTQEALDGSVRRSYLRIAKEILRQDQDVASAKSA